MEEYKTLISEKWSLRAPTFDKDHATENLNLWRHTLEELLVGKGKGSVLDVGTGTGFLAIMLAELGYRSTGIDLADGMMNIGRLSAAKRGAEVEFIKGDGEALPFESNSFDAVVNSRVLWLLLDPITAIKEWKRVLKPGGILLSFIRITTPEEKTQTADGKQLQKVIYPTEVSEAMPLRHASIERHLAAYSDAGFHNPEAILLRKDLSIVEDAKPWYVFKGIKEAEDI